MTKKWNLVGDKKKRFTPWRSPIWQWVNEELYDMVHTEFSLVDTKREFVVL
jgi:hypothetical protein